MKTGQCETEKKPRLLLKMKHNILKYTERVFNMSDSLTVLNYQMKQNTFKYVHRTFQKRLNS